MKKTNKHNAFKTPEGYFDNFTSKLLQNITDEETSSLPKEDGFKTPENYFKDLDASILKNLNTTEETKVIPLKSYKKYYYAAAAVAALFILLFNFQSTENSNTTFDVVSSSEIEAYFDTNDIGLTSYEIAEVIPVNELGINDILKKELKEENILDYLENNMDDYEELNLQYNEY